MVAFQRLETDIRNSMQSLTMVVAVEVMTGGYADESKELRAAVCRAAGLPEGPQHAHKVRQWAFSRSLNHLCMLALPTPLLCSLL